MNFTGCFILILLLQYKKVSSYLEQELQESVSKAMQCIHRDPPKDPVLALSPKRFTQLVTMLRKTSDPPVCDKSRQYPPFQLEDKNSWTFCIFGFCKEGMCQCFKRYYGPTCAEHNTKCWLMYCFLTTCHTSLQSFNCKCDSRLEGSSRVTTNEYWYDDGKKNYYEPPPPDFYQGTGQQPGEPFIGPGYNIPIQEQKSRMQPVQQPVRQPSWNSAQQQYPGQQMQNQYLVQQQQYPGQQMQNQYLPQQQQYPGQQMQNQHLGQQQQYPGQQMQNQHLGQQQQYPGQQMQNQHLAQQQQYPGQQMQNQHLAQQSLRGHSSTYQNYGDNPSHHESSNEQENLKESEDDVSDALDEMVEEASSSTTITNKKYTLHSIAIFVFFVYNNLYFLHF
ncbi:hypothetical protein TNCT_667961 [Trichonephila clavata]|uniref:Uncharacterized protein n=1 Tax=Trichonephila clavata TaxID=2740835 RepID=A0A8X6H6X9_TRICU|nr:hypothetical protein TNCT_667961 [Trichonephila clavata]